jgi:putative hydrolase
MDRVQATMAVVEGYAEHVMDAVGEQALPHYDGLRTAMQRRRNSRSAPERLLQKLLGMDMKMRQYEVGKAFCDAVVADRDIATLNRVWESSEALPDLAELSDHRAWLRRTDALPQAA